MTQQQSDPGSPVYELDLLLRDARSFSAETDEMLRQIRLRLAGFAVPSVLLILWFTLRPDRLNDKDDWAILGITLLFCIVFFVYRSFVGGIQQAYRSRVAEYDKKIASIAAAIGEAKGDGA